MLISEKQNKERVKKSYVKLCICKCVTNSNLQDHAHSQIHFRLYVFGHLLCNRGLNRHSSTILQFKRMPCVVLHHSKLYSMCSFNRLLMFCLGLGQVLLQHLKFYLQKLGIFFVTAGSENVFLFLIMLCSLCTLNKR